MPIIEPLVNTKEDIIHQARMLHCYKQMMLELIQLESDAVERILDRYSVTIASCSPGYSSFILYPHGAKQVFREELDAIKKEKEAEEACALSYLSKGVKVKNKKKKKS